MRHMIYFIKQIYSYAGKTLYLNLFSMTLVSFFEGIGVVLLIPLLNIIGKGQVNFTNIKIPVISVFDNIPSNFQLIVVLGTYVFLVIGQAIIQRKLLIQNSTIHIGFINFLRFNLYGDLLSANWEFFIRKRKSDLMNSLTDELGRVSAGTNLFFQMITAVVFTVVQLGIAFWLSAKITLFVFICGIVLVFLSRKFIIKSKYLGQQKSEIAQAYLAGISDHFNGIKEIKSNLLEKSRLIWMHTWCKEVELERMKSLQLTTFSQLIYKGTSALFIAILIYGSVKIFHTQIEQLMLIILIFTRILPRFSAIQSNLEQIASNLPAFRAIIQLQKECEEFKELSDIENNANLNPLNFKDQLVVDNLSFRYNQRQLKYALQNINFQIPANKTVAVVGPSGAGKSTLIDILMGLLRPEKGELLIDGIPLSKENIMSWRRIISYVPQDPFLFNTSIRENLLMVAPNVEEHQIWEALEFSAGAAFVKSLPQGLDTIVGDRGVRLSGGERQRIVLARAILRKPSILFLDEATSALDSENEFRIQEALERLKGKMTVIVIAHRLSTIKNADQVIVIEQGEIIQQGQFSQLASEKSGLFNHLLSKQMG